MMKFSDNGVMLRFVGLDFQVIIDVNKLMVWLIAINCFAVHASILLISFFFSFWFYSQQGDA